MKPSFHQLLAGLAWGALAISTAAPANALAGSFYTGDYAHCSSSVSAEVFETPCLTFSYTQSAKLLAHSCGSGFCSGSGILRTDIPYSLGRKTATLLYRCGSGHYIHELGDCAC
jgi:hypothetical protein